MIRAGRRNFKSPKLSEAVEVLFGIDPVREPDRARRVYDSHLARARWMTQSGYRQLLGPRSGTP